LTSEAKATGRPAWSADGRAIIFASRAEGTLALSQVDVKRALADGPQKPTRLLEGEGESTAPAVSGDGRTLLFTVTRNSYSIVMLDPNQGTERSLRESRLHLMSPVISDDGRRIAFFGWGRDGSMHVYTMDLNGGNLVQVTSPEAGDDESTFPIWSADGSELFFYRDTSDPSWRRVAAAGRGMIRLDHTGRKAVYTWMERDIARVTRVVDLETGVEREFHRLLRYPSFAADGRSIIGVDMLRNPAARLGPLVACPLDPAPCRQLAPLATHSKTSTDGAIVYFQRPLQLRHAVELWAVRMDGSDLRTLQSFTTETPYVPAFDVAPSGEIVVAQFRQGTHELWLGDLTK
jgi:Tol biopolymer transport system component